MDFLEEAFPDIDIAMAHGKVCYGFLLQSSTFGCSSFIRYIIHFMESS